MRFKQLACVAKQMAESFSQIRQCPKGGRLVRRGEGIEEPVLHSESGSSTVEVKSSPAFEPLSPTMPEVAQALANGLLRFKETFVLCSLVLLLTKLLPQ